MTQAAPDITAAAHALPPLRILMLATGMKLGGAEQQVATLAARYRALGHAVALVSLTPGCEVKVPDGVELLQLDMRKTPLSMARALWRMRRFVAQWRPTVIHAHMIHANLFARALARLGAAPPVICTAHSYREGGRLRMAAYRMTERWAALTTHVGQEGRQRMIDARAAAAERIIVTPNGIDTVRFRPDPGMRAVQRATLGIAPGEALVVNVGRLVPDKAQALLIDAFAMLAPDARARLLIAGDGPLRAMLSARIAALGQQHRITLLGVRHDIPALLNAADLFVLSSDIEGMPLAIGEALGCGCPVVATDAPGVAAMLGRDADRDDHDARTGTASELDSLMVPRGDARALCAGIETMLARQPADPEARELLRRHRNSALGARLGIDSVAARWIDIYRAVSAGQACQLAGRRTQTVV